MNKNGGPKGPRTYNASRHCGAPTKSRNKAPCVRSKGERTSHPGQGRCWIHGGRNSDRIKHGLYATVENERIRDAIKKVREQVTDVMDLTPEAELLRGLTHDFVSRYTAMRDALMGWHMSFEPGFQMLVKGGSPEEMVKAIEQIRNSVDRRPREVILDIESAAKLAGEVGRMVERIHKIKQTSAVTWEAVQLMLERMGMVLLKHMKDPAIVAAITRDWGNIDIPLTPVR